MKRKGKKKALGNNYVFGIMVIVLISIVSVFWLKRNDVPVVTPLTSEEVETQDKEAERINKMIYDTDVELMRLGNEDLKKTGGKNQQMFNKLRTNLQMATDSYENLLDLRYNGIRVNTEEERFADLLSAARIGDVKMTDETLSNLLSSLSTQKNLMYVRAVVAAGPSIPASVPAINQAPGSGYRRQKVTVGGRSYLVDIQAADLNSTKVIVDTASDGTCTDNCPVLPLGTYVSRSGAYAGVNGTYFCPDTYPSCAGKKNSFDILVMNKNKVYFNSDNNVFSTVPAAIFSPGSARFVTTSREWGRDTGVDSVIANRPLLTFNGAIMTGGGEAKENIRGNRSFVGSTGNTVYIGVVRSASIVEVAKVLQTIGVQNAINLDNGGSTAFWSGGYKAGPGRRIPNAVLFVQR
ncbi:MAG: hypothetical protein UW68_C0004G0018 [Candidatus Collierbacteria bacterium GW2011_GWB1_44_6]|uniref:Phosphodiester glycosidase domain-containing protein n=2 Tax=Candidatus Collieribacteriota TaxID=1752725 RepID=A0A0G1JQ62_9BACT|nr:MAG: hypothetical protein UV68_C0047G0001 [Candidatus Collierbacteria bacterium GW2011_GWC2_43_12]KKT73661.1 MAG: hypothetical protein UW68_C0004G0018 [Candidatus Collierbacteria bacterium GW2011_GWB1_44_6]